MAERLRDKFKKVIGLEDEIDEPEEYGEYDEYGSYGGYDDYDDYDGRGSYRREAEQLRGDYSRARSKSSGGSRTQAQAKNDFVTPRVDPSSKVVDLKEASEASAAKKDKRDEQMKLVITEPKSLNDCPKLVDNLRTKKPVIINLGTIADVSTKHKIFDFMSGATYAVDGKVQKITDGIFIFAPINVEVMTIEKDENGKPKNVSMKDMSWTK